MNVIRSSHDLCVFLQCEVLLFLVYDNEGIEIYYVDIFRNKKLFRNNNNRSQITKTQQNHKITTTTTTPKAYKSTIRMVSIYKYHFIIVNNNK
eukprot:m.296829 g.296829  ORF g.296829 m.296829 type:complete len:93 (-) comp16393_c9_seq2:26-304(-)